VTVFYFGSALGALGCTVASNGQTLAIEGPSGRSTNGTYPYGPGPQCRLNRYGGTFGVIFAIYAMVMCLVTWAAANSARAAAGSSFCCGKSTSTDRHPKVNIMVCIRFALNLLALMALSFNFEAPSNVNELDFEATTYFPTPSPSPNGTAAPGWDPNAHFKISCQALTDVDNWKQQLPCNKKKNQNTTFVPVPPTPVPAPAAPNQCDPSKACNVCKACCKSVFTQKRLRQLREDLLSHANSHADSGAW